MSGGRVQLENVSGSLRGPVRIERLRIETPGTRILVSTLFLDWDLSALWSRHLEIEEMRAAEVRVERREVVPDTEAPGPVRLPFSFSIERAAAARLEIVAADREYAFEQVAAWMRGERATEPDRLAFGVQANQGAVALEAMLGLGDARTYTLEGRLVGLDLAGVNPELPASHLDAEVSAEGRLEPDWRVRLAFSLGDSRLNDYPLSGRGLLAVEPGRVREADVQLRLAENTATATGAFGAAGDRLTWRVDAPALARIGKGFSGRLQASGLLAGTPGDFSLRFTLDGSDLALFDTHFIERLEGSGDLNDAFSARVALRGYRGEAIVLSEASASVAGTRAQHTVEAVLENEDLDLTAAARGGWDGHVWSGELYRLVNRGRFATRLQTPLAVELARERVLLRDGTFQVGPGTAHLARLERRGGVVETQGRAQAIPLAWLQRFVPRELPIRSSLTLSGEWDLRVGETIAGTVRVAREDGDIVVQTAPAQRLGLSHLLVEANIDENAVAARLDAAGSTIGEIAVEARTRVARRDGRWGIPGTAPLSVQARATLPSLSWLEALTRDRARLDGRLELEARADGTVAEPQWDGRVRGEQLALGLPEQGISWRNGELAGVFENERLIVQRLRLEGQQGTLNATGSVSLTGDAARMEFALEGLQVVRLPEREIVASGGGTAVLEGRRLRVNGDLRIDRARIELPEEEAPTLSEDVVVLGREEQARPPAGPRFVTEAEVEIDFGDRFYVRGRGLDARLAGSVRVRAAETGLPLAFGTVRVAEGTYSAYGQRLSVDRGILTFNGPIDNPGLNILALRKNQPVEAGVAVTGTVLDPRVQLVSVPEVPDSEKLAWLVLGHGLEGTSEAEFDLLSAAAGALLARGESVTLQSRIAQRAGLDEFRISGRGELEEAIVTLGKRVSSDVYLTYEQGLTGATSLFSVRYSISPQWSLRTQTGTRETAVDLFYTITFD